MHSGERWVHVGLDCDTWAVCLALSNTGGEGVILESDAVSRGPETQPNWACVACESRYGGTLSVRSSNCRSAGASQCVSTLQSLYPLYHWSHQQDPQLGGTLLEEEKGCQRGFNVEQFANYSWAQHLMMIAKAAPRVVLSMMPNARSPCGEGRAS